MDNRIWKRFEKLSKIDSISFKEREFCDALKIELEDLGISTFEDDAGEKIQGNSGNLFGFVAGALDKPPLLLSAHMDTVEPGNGIEAVIDEEGIITSVGDTILGADDLSGIVIILEAIQRLKEQNIPHRPLELLFTVSEERSCLGSANADYSKLKAKEAYTFDLGGPTGSASNAAPTIMSFEITVNGKAAHAGVSPELGIHAIKTAASAVARLPLGKPEAGISLNVGKISGGGATNVVPDKCVVVGEIRGDAHEAALGYWDIVQGIFEEETKKVGATFDAKSNVGVKAYNTPFDSPVIKRFERACSKVGATPNIVATLGGSDQNNYALHGIEGIVVAGSMYDVHGINEYAKLDELEKAVELLTVIILDD